MNGTKHMSNSNSHGNCMCMHKVLMITFCAYEHQASTARLSLKSLRNTVDVCEMFTLLHRMATYTHVQSWIIEQKKPSSLPFLLLYDIHGTV